MEAQTAVAAVAAGIAAIISVTVPWMTFRLALRQDRLRWLRDKRTELYVDVLTEAHAERQWFEHEILDPDRARDRAPRHFDDVRLPAFDRAHLGARGTAYGSRTINRLFTDLQGVGLRFTLPPPKDEGERVVARMRMAEAFDALETAIRRELGADDPRLNAPSRPGL